MKKFSLKLVYFVAYFVLFFAVTNTLYFCLIRFTDWDFKKRVESIGIRNSDFELLVLGASVSLDGIDTELLSKNGIKSYNLALGGSTVKTNYFQLAEYLENNAKKPKFVLLGLHSREQKFDDDGIHPIVEFTMNNHEFSLKDIPILKFKWLGFEFLKKLVSAKHRNAKLSYGQLKFQKALPDKSHYAGINLDVESFVTSCWISKIAKLCDQNEINLIVLEMPGFKKIQNTDEIGPYPLKLKNGCQVYLYNFAAISFCKIFDNNSHWIANSHLNEFGAIVFTNELIKTLNLKSSR